LWVIARAMSSRRKNAMPSPLSRATAGISTGSAYGAVNRTTKCSPTKSTPRSAAGTQNAGVTVSYWLDSTTAL
jgi:hypothetical protein